MGLGLVAVGVGLLEFTLDKGQEKDWFGDPMIRTTSVLAVCLLIFFAVWEWRHPDPIVDLKLLQNRNFGTAVFLQLVLGMVLFGSTVLIPQYVQVLLGYTAERAGMVMSPAAFLMMFMMFIAGRTVGKIDPRLMVCIAYLITAMGIFNLTHLDLTTSFAHVTELRMLQVIALPFVFIPISTLNYVGVPAAKTNQISSLSNFARNLGGSRRHRAADHVSSRAARRCTNRRWRPTWLPGSVAYSLYLDRAKEMLVRGGMAPSVAAQTAIGEAYQMMLRQASMLSYANVFAILSCVVVLLSPLPFLMRLPPKRGPKPAAEDLAGD